MKKNIRLVLLFVAVYLVLLGAIAAWAMRFDDVEATNDLRPKAAITYGSGAYHTGSYSPYAEFREAGNPAAAPTFGTFSNGTTTGTTYKKTSGITQPGEVRSVKVTAAGFTQITGLKPVTVYGKKLDGTRVTETVSFNRYGIARTRNCFGTISSITSSTANNVFGTATSTLTVSGGKRFQLANKAVTVHKQSFNGAGSATAPTVDTTYNCYSSASALDGSKREEVWYKGRIQPYQ